MPREPAPSAPPLLQNWMLSDIDEGGSATLPLSPLTGRIFTATALASEFEMPRFSHDSNELVTSASAARPGGAAIIVDDAAAINDYGLVTWTRTDMIAQSDTDVRFVIERIIRTHKSVVSRITEVVVRPTFSDAAMWLAACCELNDAIRVRITHRGLDRYGYVIGVAHDVSMNKNVWTTTLTITEGGQ